MKQYVRSIRMVRVKERSRVYSCVNECRNTVRSAQLSSPLTCSGLFIGIQHNTHINCGLLAILPLAHMAAWAIGKRCHSLKTQTHADNSIVFAVKASVARGRESIVSWLLSRLAGRAHSYQQNCISLRTQCVSYTYTHSHTHIMCTGVGYCGAGKAADCVNSDGKHNFFAATITSMLERRCRISVFSESVICKSLISSHRYGRCGDCCCAFSTIAEQTNNWECSERKTRRARECYWLTMHDPQNSAIDGYNPYETHTFDMPAEKIRKYFSSLSNPEGNSSFEHTHTHTHIYIYSIRI